jgi:hypothetical protein
MKEWKSCAEWSAGALHLASDDNTTRDGHDTESQAAAVCRALESDGLGGDGRIFPLRTWVESSKPNNEINRK